MKRICIYWGNGKVTEFYVPYRILRAVQCLLNATDCMSSEYEEEVEE